MPIAVSTEKHVAAKSQSFRISVPNEVRISLSNRNAEGQAQGVHVSAGIDVVVVVERQGVSSTPQQPDYSVFYGPTSTVPVEPLGHGIEISQHRFPMKMTILPGW